LALIVGLFATTGCASDPPPRAKIAMERLPEPPVLPRRGLHLHVGEPGSVVVDAVVAQADDPSLVRVYEQDGSFAVVGRKVGKTVIHFTTKNGSMNDVDAEIMPGEAQTRALAIGETLILPMKGVKEFSVGLPDVVAATLTGDGTQLLVTGKKPGATTIVLFGPTGAQSSHEVVVFGGRRQG
jgi:Flp pilus assembly secretin CpaC